MSSLETTVQLLQAFSDPTRMRLLALLGNEELTVFELTQITNLAQSRVSTHLGKLREAGLLCDRREGTASYYGLNGAAKSQLSGQLWQLVRARLTDEVLKADERRLSSLLQARKRQTPWLDSVAGEMERHYSPGRTWEATARGLLGFVSLGDVLDVGSGDGVIAELVAPQAKKIVCLDRSERMVRAAKRRLKRYAHAQCRVGDMHAMPFADGSFDEVLCFNALTYSEAPERAVAEMARVLRQDGKLSLLCLHEHSEQATTRRYEHANDGFSLPKLEKILNDCAFSIKQCRICSRERNKPYFEVIWAFAVKTPGSVN